MCVCVYNVHHQAENMFALVTSTNSYELFTLHLRTEGEGTEEEEEEECEETKCRMSQCVQSINQSINQLVINQTISVLEI